MVMSAVGAPTAGAAPAAKYFVCKYVGTPGTDERLQTGQNPIDVNASAIKEDPIVVGSFFADDQGRSFVLAADTGQPDPDVSECPPPDTGGSTPPPTTEPPSSEPPSSEPPSSLPVTITDTATASATASEVVTETQAAAPQAAGPIPAGVNAGLHTPDSNAGLKAWGILLMLLGGAAGLVFGLRPSRGRAH
jgi:hypothetical protein